MEIVWDEPKRISNLAKHDLDFADLTLEFFLDAHVVSSHSGRYKAISVLDDRHIVVVFSQLGSEAISILSMRTANKRERIAP